MGVEAARTFWTQDNEYQNLAREYEDNIDIVHPQGASCFCGASCPWAATKVTYYEYNGPSL